MHRLLRTANFRLGLLYAVIFSFSVFILGIIVFYSVKTSLEQHLRTQIELDATQLMGDYRDDGIEELRHDIRERIEANPANRLVYFVQSPGGRVIFDRIESLPPPGWHKIVTAEGRGFLLHSIALDDGYLFAVGADLSRAHEIQKTLRNTFAAVFILILLFGAAGGLLVSRRFLANVDRLNRHLAGIGRQRTLADRLPVRGTGDDFDQLASIINEMLDRIEKLVHEVKQVSTNIAHDLRTPLGQIRQKVEQLSISSNSPVMTRDLEDVLQLLDSTIGTFSALLRIAEIESGSRRSGFTDVDLLSVLNRIAAAYGPVAEESGHILHFKLQPCPRIHGDENLLVQLFSNLIENSIHHTPPGTSIVFYLETAAHHIQVRVSDNGPGVPDSERQNILKPFYRLDSSRHQHGSGLGLSLVAAVAELHQAGLQIQNQNPGLLIELSFPKT